MFLPVAPDLSCTLIRAPGGMIISWSPGMERLYGYAREVALGQRPDALLRTVFPQALSTIEAELERHGYWSGGLIQRRQDNQGVVVAAHWFRCDPNPMVPPIVVEIHNELSPSRQPPVTTRPAADALAELAHELSEPQTAIGNIIEAALLTIGRPRPDIARLRKALTAAAQHAERSRVSTHVLRQFADRMRTP